MASLKSITKLIIFVIGGIAILIVGSFMLGSIMRLWGRKDATKKSKGLKRQYHGIICISILSISMLILLQHLYVM